VALVAASSSSFFVMSRRPVRCSCCWLEGTKKARAFERERERGCVHFAKSSWKVTVALFVVIW
jgi:hypothetical protein